MRAKSLLVAGLVAGSLALTACSGLGKPPEPEGICRPAEITQSVLTIAGEDYSGQVQRIFVKNDAYSAGPSLYIALNATGAQRFAELTEQLVGEEIDLAINGEILTSPRVFEAIRGGRVQITGAFSLEEASNLAQQIAPPCK